MRANLNLDLIAPSLRALAVEDFEQDDVLGFLGKAQRDTERLFIVEDNARALKERGLYEEALLHAWTDTRTNHSHLAALRIRSLFDLADKAKLRALGDPLPGPGPFTAYR